jgi:hypothetical protein
METDSTQFAKQLAKARQIRDEYKQEVAELEKEFQEMPFWKYVQKRKELLKTAEADVKEVEDRLRRMNVLHYENTGERAFPGSEIALYKVLIYEQEKAFDWAKEKGLALKFDKPAFEKYAKQKPEDFPFVEITQEPRARIKSDLSEFLEADNE